jgi:hypothetical protein
MDIHLRKITWVVFLVLALTLAGCLGGNGPEIPEQLPVETATESPVEPPVETPVEPSPELPTATEEDLDAQYTQAAETIIAELTSNAPPADTPIPDVSKPTLTPTETLPPTSTPQPTRTPLPSDTPLPQDTTQPESAPTKVATATTSTSSTLPGDFRIVFEDDFSLRQGWVTDQTDQFSFSFGNGGYLMKNKLVEDMVWSVRATPFSGVRVEATGQRISGPRDGYYGVTCRHEDGSYYYALVVGSDGSYGIAKQFSGFLEFIELDVDTKGRVYTGNGINHIRADCIGSTLTLYANDHKLIEVQDPTFTAGSVGMVVGTREKTNYEVLFTYFALYLPVE